MNQRVLLAALALIALLLFLSLWLMEQRSTPSPATELSVHPLPPEQDIAHQEQNNSVGDSSVLTDPATPSAASEPTRWIHGIVTDAKSGSVIPYAGLQLLDPMGWAKFSQADKHGSFHFADLPAGPAFLLAHSRGFRLVKQRANVSASNPTTEVNLELQPGGRFPVRFVDHEGRRFSLVLREDPLFDSLYASYLMPTLVASEANQAGELPGIAAHVHDEKMWAYSKELSGEFDGILYWNSPGDGNVVAAAHGAVLGSMRISGDETELVMICDMERLKTCVQFINLKIHDEATLQTIEYASISIDGANGGMVLRSTAIDGLHRVGPLPPGYFRVSVHLASYASQTVHLNLSALRNTPPLAIALGRGQWVEGRVVDQEERGVAGAGMLVAEEGEHLEDRPNLPSSSSLLFTNSEGRFRFHLTHGKRFTLYATADGFQSQRSSFDLGEGAADAISLVLAPATATEIVIPIEDPLPQLWLIYPTDGELLETRAVRTFGRQELFLPKGSYRIRALTTMGTTERSIEVGG